MFRNQINLILVNPFKLYWLNSVFATKKQGSESDEYDKIQNLKTKSDLQDKTKFKNLAVNLAVNLAQTCHKTDTRFRALLALSCRQSQLSSSYMIIVEQANCSN